MSTPNLFHAVLYPQSAPRTPPQRPGCFVVTGPMCAGKSTTLLKAARHWQAGRVLVVSHTLHRTDTRTHAGADYAPVRVDEILPVALQRCEQLDSLFIDEAQFFDRDDLHLAIIHALSTNCAVYVAGLDTDHRRRPFPWLAPLEDLRWPHERYMLTANCTKCKTNGTATLTAYTGPPFTDEFAPDSTDFHPVCPQCWEPPTWTA